MIYDSLTNLCKYKTFNVFFDVVDTFIKTNNLDDLPLGKTIINDNIYLNKEMYFGKKDNNEAQFEVHATHYDIQLVLFGNERVKTINNIDGEHEYDVKGDISFAKSLMFDCVFTLKPGFFLFLEPGEWHKPCLIKDGKKITKIVFKINK